MKFAQVLSVMLISVGGGVPMAAAGPDAVPETIVIPAGDFIAGSNQGERDAAYDLDQAAYGHDRTRKWRWYDDERPRRGHNLPTFAITRTTITNRQYAAFVAATSHPAPDVSRKVWHGYGLIHPYQRTRRHAWQNRRPPPGRDDHPVVLVSYHDAMAYAAWLGSQGKGSWRLPNELEWEKAARGGDGRRFPWGDDYNAKYLNSHDTGPFDTLPVGRFAHGASPFGLMDAAGQVFEWTASAGGKKAGAEGRYLVKGGSWDDKGCGICRPAARHSRPAGLKHILIGFRLVRD
jgi:formylglycine-generating enzyme required for sulfatase activity